MWNDNFIGLHKATDCPGEVPMHLNLTGFPKVRWTGRHWPGECVYKNETRRTTNILNLEYIKYGNDPKTISVSLAVSNSLHNTVHIGMITSRLLENTETSKFLLPLTVTWRPMQIQRNPKHIEKKWKTRYNPPDIYRDFNENISNTPEEHLSIAEKPKTQTHLNTPNSCLLRCGKKREKWGMP